jgi:hypothetical protein
LSPQSLLENTALRNSQWYLGCDPLPINIPRLSVWNKRSGPDGKISSLFQVSHALLDRSRLISTGNAPNRIADGCFNSIQIRGRSATTSNKRIRSGLVRRHFPERCRPRSRRTPHALDEAFHLNFVCIENDCLLLLIKPVPIKDFFEIGAS